MLDNFYQNNIKKFLISISTIIVVGILMVYSSSYIYAQENFGTSYHFLLRQMAYLIIAVFSAFIVSKTKFSFWEKNIFYFNGFAAFLLILTFVPSIGLSLKGSNRWISLGFFTFQPSEIVKYTTLFSSIIFFEKFQARPKNDNILLALNLSFPLLLLAIQPDFGSFAICMITIMFTCFLSDFPRKYFYSFIGVGVIGVSMVLVAAPYRVKRLLIFLDPWSDPQNSGFQIIQSYLAFANGSISGMGIGNSNEKLFYLPEAYNDFIFSVIGEELGFIGVLFIVMLYVSFLLFGFKISVQQKFKTHQMFISSIIFLISFQAFLNMGVVLGILPTKGLNLPFISYGGSSLIMNIVAIGMILSAIRNDRKNAREMEVNFQG